MRPTFSVITLICLSLVGNTLAAGEIAIPSRPAPSMAAGGNAVPFADDAVAAILGRPGPAQAILPAQLPEARRESPAFGHSHVSL